MFAYAIMFLGSTETSDCTTQHLKDYAARCKAAGWNPRRVRVCIWPLANFVESARKDKPETTEAEVIEQQAKLGIHFFKTKKQALAEGRALVSRAEEVITEVYGTSRRKRALCAGITVPRRRAA